jgi:hypothetical protein
MLEKASRLRLLLSIHRANPLPCNENLYVGFRNFQVLYSRTRLACWPLVPKIAGSLPAEGVGFFSGDKILSMPSFGREVKPSAPCSRFAACQRTL